MMPGNKRNWPSGTAGVKKKITPVEFIEKLLEPCTQVERTSGIHFLYIITQAAHESSWGNSYLARFGNNLFGITGDSWKTLGNPTIDLPTTEYSTKKPEEIEYWRYPSDISYKRWLPEINKTRLRVLRPFRSYKNWSDSVKDWVSLITGLSRYKNVVAAGSDKNPENFFLALQKSGYATDPEYAIKLFAVYKSVLKRIPIV